MEVDVASDDEESDEEASRGTKRVRPEDDRLSTIHEEPKLKRARTQEELSPQTQRTEQTFSASSSASVTTAVATPSEVLSTSAALLPVILTARKTLTKEEADSIISFSGAKEKPAARLIFGESQLEWPAGYALLLIPILPPVLEVLIKDCNAYLLNPIEERISVILLTPDSDRQQFTKGLIENQCNETATDADQEDEESTENCITTALMVAADWGDVSATRTLLDNGANPNAQNADNTTALMLAAARGHIRIVRMLIHHQRTNATLTNDYGFDALQYAALNGHADVCELLLNFGGATITWRTDSHPLLLAAKAGHTKVCKLLIERNVNVDLENSDRQTALILAAGSNHLECCRLLLEMGADPGHIDSDGDSPLSMVCVYGYLELFNLLIEKGAPVNSDRYTNTPLIYAAAKNHTDLILRLIDLKADLEASSGPENDTALSLACLNMHEEAALILLKAGADPYRQTNPFRTALAFAAQSGLVQALSFMLEQNPRPARKATIGYTALMLAIQSGHVDAAKLLLEAKTPVEVPNKNFSAFYPPLLNMLFIASPPNTLQLLDLLLKFGAPWNHTDSSGYDALMTAALCGDFDSIIMLLEHGAVIGQLNTFSASALQICADSFEEILDGPGVASPRANLLFNCFILMIEAARRQPDWISLRNITAKKLRHRLTRELLWQQTAWLPKDYKLPCVFDPEPMNRESLFQFIESLAKLDTQEWDIEDIEWQLQTLLIPLPIIDFLRPYFRALPALKDKLFVSLAAPQTQESLGRSLAIGMTATLERMLVEPHLISDSYDALGWNPAKSLLSMHATTNVSVIIDWGIHNESQMLMPAFETLFDSCLQFTLNCHQAPHLSLEFAPKSGVIATELMAKGVFPALAEAIDAGWRQSWRETCHQQSATMFLSSASASFGTDSNLADLNSGLEEFSLWDFLDPENSSSVSASAALSENQSDQLLQTFRTAMASIVDSPDIMMLPETTAEVAGVYADLMHRQVYMLAQFVREGAVTKAVAKKQAPALM